MKKIVILSTISLPKFIESNHPAEKGLFAEEELLIIELKQRGFTVLSIPWRTPDINWNDYDFALIRSTWDYIDDIDAFLTVLAKIEISSCLLINPINTVRWNINKRYLLELENRGVKIVPTLLCSEIDSGMLRTGIWNKQTDGFVIKPLVGVGAFQTLRIKNLESLCNFDKEEFNRERYLIQPFLKSIQQEGELSFVYFNKKLSYTTLKRPASNDFRVQVMYGGTTIPVEPSREDIYAADCVMDALPVLAIYARIDMVRLPTGQLALIEAELIEPQLFFSIVNRNAARLAETIAYILSVDHKLFPRGRSLENIVDYDTFCKPPL